MIPKLLHQIWVGPKDPPRHWMDTWKHHHPHWHYTLWDNEALHTRDWANKRILGEYITKREWRGVADVMRYEILYEMGGFMPGADSECLRPVDELLTEPGITTYAVYENEIAAPGLITPVYAAIPGSEFVSVMLDRVSVAEAGEPWEHVGNRLMQQVYESRPWPNTRIWPSWTFNPEHYTGIIYDGREKPFANQHWGSTKKVYA